MNAEVGLGIVSIVGNRLASMEPRSRERGSLPISVTIHSGPGAASMEPRSRERGSTTGTPAGATGTTGFNGAAFT